MKPSSTTPASKECVCSTSRRAQKRADGTRQGGREHAEHNEYAEPEQALRYERLKGPAGQVIAALRAAAANGRVGGNPGNREPGEQSNQSCEQQNQQCRLNAGRAHHFARAHEHDGAEDGQN